MNDGGTVEMLSDALGDELSAATGYPMPDDAREAVRAPGAPPVGTPIPPHYAGCFACGSDHPDGLHLGTVAGEGVSVTSRFVVSPAHQGAPGLVHGGVLAAALDETMGFLLWLMELPGVTAKLEVSYRAPVPIGSAVTGRGLCTGVAGRKVYVVGDLSVGETLVAEARALFVVVGIEHFAAHLPAGMADPMTRRFGP